MAVENYMAINTGMLVSLSTKATCVSPGELGEMPANEAWSRQSGHFTHLGLSMARKEVASEGRICM